MLSKINFYKGMFRLWIILYIVWLIFASIEYNSKIILVYDYYFDYDKANYDLAASTATQLDVCSDLLSKKNEKYYISGVEINSYEENSYWCKTLLSDKLYSHTDIVIIQDVISCAENKQCSDVFKVELSNRLENLKNDIKNRKSIFSINDEHKNLLKYFIIYPIASLALLILSIISFKFICIILKWIFDGFISKTD